MARRTTGASLSEADLARVTLEQAWEIIAKSLSAKGGETHLILYTERKLKYLKNRRALEKEAAILKDLESRLEGSRTIAGVLEKGYAVGYEDSIRADGKKTFSFKIPAQSSAGGKSRGKKRARGDEGKDEEGGAG